MRHRLACLLAVALLPSALFAAESRTIRVALRPPDGAAAAVEGTVTLRAFMGPQEPLTRAITTFAEPLAFVVPARSMWEVTVAAGGWWAAPAIVSVQDVDGDVVLPLLPAAIVRGKLVMPKNVAVPRSLSVRIDVPPGARALPGPASAESSCAVMEDAAFTCAVPAGTLDLTFLAKGCAPVYRWGVAVTREGGGDVGALTLREGSAVSGFVALAGAKIEAGKGKVALFIEAPGGGSTAARLSRAVAEAPLAANGFFQMTGVPPGRYVLQASHPGFAPATVSPVEVYRDVESKLRRAVELQRPMTLTLRIEPPLDPEGRAWRVTVMRASQVNRRYDDAPVFDGASKEGMVSLPDQPGGRYDVTVADANGHPFLTEELSTAGGGDETHTLRPKFVRVRGTIRRGEAPVAAALWFGGRHGERRMALRSNEEGAFRGVLPGAGFWRVRVVTGSTETDLTTDVPEPLEGDEAEVALTIPANHIEGIVVDAAGAPQRGAMVRYLPAAVTAAQTRQTDADGRFAFDGVAAGAFELDAQSKRATLAVSERHRGTIGEDESLGGVRLVLRDGRPLHGRVVGRDGAVIGAEVRIRPGDALQPAPVSRATTGPDGLFDASIAPGFEQAIVEVFAPGHALRAFEIALDGRAVTLNLPHAGGSLYVDMPADANGIVLFQDGRDLSLGTLYEWARSRGESLLAGGDVRANDLAAGRYRVCTMTPRGTTLADLTRCAEGFLPPFGELQLTLK